MASSDLLIKLKEINLNIEILEKYFYISKIKNSPKLILLLKQLQANTLFDANINY